ENVSGRTYTFPGVRYSEASSSTPTRAFARGNWNNDGRCRSRTVCARNRASSDAVRTSNWLGRQISDRQISWEFLTDCEERRVRTGNLISRRSVLRPPCQAERCALRARVCGQLSCDVRGCSLGTLKAQWLSVRMSFWSRACPKGPRRDRWW